MKDREIEEMKRLRRAGATFEQIAGKTQYSVNTVKKYCKGIKRGNGQAGKSLIEVTSNPLLALQDLDDIMHVAASTGVSLASGIEAIYRGFTDKTLSDKDRMLLAMKGGSHLLGVGTATAMTLEKLAEASETPKTVESPAYEDLTEKVKVLEEDKRVLEKLVKRSKDRDNKE